MDYQDSTARSHRSHRRPIDGTQGGNFGPSGSRHPQGEMTPADGTHRVNQELRWEKVPVVHTGGSSSNNMVRVLTTGRFNGPRPEASTYQGTPTDALFQAMNQPYQDQNFWHASPPPPPPPHHHHVPQGYFQQPQAVPHHPKIVKVPMLIEVAPAPQSPAKAEPSLPVVPAKISHSFEIVRASLVRPGTPLGPYSSQTLTVDESELEEFDPFKKQESILKSLDLDSSSPPTTTRLRRGLSTPDGIVMKETSFGPEPSALSSNGNNDANSSNDLNNNTNNGDDDDAEIIIDSAPRVTSGLLTEQQQRQDHYQDRRQDHQHRPQHPLSPSKSTAGDSKSGPLFRKPSIRRKSNPLAAFLTGGSREVKKSAKSKAVPGSGVLPSGLKIRERGCSLTRCPTDSKTRLDQLMGNNTSAKNADPLSDAWTDYIESTYEKYETVLRKEQEGYGIQLHGQYPVVVDNVRPGGGAGKGGIMKGDIIFKINGKLVIKQNHEYVIECFKNPFMSITVLRAPQTGEPKQTNLTTLFGQGDKISNPAPAARDKNLELEKNTLATLRSMYVQAVGELEQLKSEAQRNSDDLTMMRCEKQTKLIHQLERRISQMELSSGQPGLPSNPSQEAIGSIGYSHATLPKLSMPSEQSLGPLTAPSQVHAPEILSMEGLDNPVEDENEALVQHKEFEDLNLLRQSPPHLACFLKYLVQSSNPNYMLFYVVANCYVQSSLKETSQSTRWAFEIYLAFLLETSPLPLRLHPNVVKFVESCLSSGKDTKSIFHSALSSVQEQIVKQLEEFQHQRTLGLGNFFGEEFLPKPKSNLSTSSSFTAPVNYHTSNRPPLSHSNLSLTSSPSTTSVNVSVAPSRGTGNLSSSSFSHAKSSSIGGGSDVFVVEKILWEVFESCLAREGENSWKPEETRPAVAAALATFFRHQCIPLSRQNQTTLDGTASFVWRDKKALKSKLKTHVAYNDHDFAPHLCGVMSVVECALCSNVLWGAGHQGHRCQCCDMVLHNGCMRLPSVPQCSKVPSKRSGRDESSSTFYAPEPTSFHSLPLRKKKKGFDDGPVFSDSENAVASELDLVGSPTGCTTPFISGHGSGPSLTHMSSGEFENDSDLDVEQDLPPLSKVIPEDALSQLVGVARKKQEIINELFYTERSHVKSLLITIHHYLVPMRNDPKIDQNLVSLLFPNLESIAQWHRELSRDFKARRKEQPVVQEIGDILMNRFSGPNGLLLQEQCAEFCKDQLVNLDLLKNRRRQDAYLNHFIMNATQKEVCKKQDLKDRLPKVMQRLTKYPLLFDNLLKITPAGTMEHAKLLRALKNIRMILDEINETVRESENRRVLHDMQRRMDTKHLENLVNYPILEEFKNTQLVEHKLRHHGPLTWNASASKNIELHLALFQDFLVIFQIQDNRLVLKCETTGQDSAKFVFVPVLKPGNLLVKDAPRTTRKFYLINASKEASQMYTLTAKTKDVREEWMRQIREVTEEYKKKHGQPQSPSKQPPKPSVLTEVNPCYEVVEPEPVEASQRKEGEAAGEKERAEDVTDAGKEEADDDELANNDHSSAAYDPEKELKRQIIATHELMMDKVKALSELHHIESPNFDLSEKTLPLDTDSDTFITTMDVIIDGMTEFFTSLPDVVLPGSDDGDGSQEWDPVESLLELGERLEMLVRQLENLVLQRNAVPDVPPPLPTSEPPQMDEGSDRRPEQDPNYVERNF